MIIGKLTQQGELKLSGGIDTRLPLVADGLVAHYPMDGTIEKYFPKTFRYIRDWCNGNTINTGSHWVEIQAIDYSGVNLALNGTATSTKIIDDVIDTVSYYNRGNILAAVIVDLLDEYSIKDVIVYHWYSDGRSYYDTKTEVSEDGVTWYSIFDSAIEGIYAEPLDGTGKTHNLQNLGTTVNPITNTGTTITNDYVAVEEATTNVIPDGDFTGGLKHPYAYANNAVLSIVGNFEHGGYMLKHATTSSGTDSYSSGSNFPLAPAISGDTWTTRIFARATRENTSVQLFLFGLNVSNSYVDYGAVGKIISPSDGWVELTYTRTFTNAAVVNVASRIDVDAASTVVYWRQWQLEKKAFATEYVNGSRSTAGYMTYSADNIDRTKGTIHIETFITSQLFSTTSYIDMLNTSDSVGGGSNDFIMIRKSAGQVLPTQMFLRNGNGWVASTITPHILDGAWNTFTWAWNTTTGYSLTVNGTIVASAASYTQTDQTYDTLILQRGWSIKNLSIYNRALSDAEVKKLAKGTHSITSTGLIANSIMSQHKPPLGSNYFPLDFDGKDYYKTILPTKDEATVYTDGSVWVGSGTTNKITNGNFESLSGWSSTQGELLLPYANTLSLRRNVAGTGDFQLSKSISALAGETLIFSCKCKCIVGSVGLDPAFAINFGIWSALPSWNFSKTSSENIGDGWFRLIYTLTALSENVTGTTGFHSMPNDLISTYLIREMQLENSKIATPFVDGTRAQSSLHLPYNIIDCKQDFTIYGWWYPKVYADGVYRPCLTRNIPDGNSTYNRILIMGNGTSRQLKSWNSSDGTTEGATYVPTTTLVSDNEWNFFCYRRSGANIILSLGNSTGISHGISANAAHLDFDETGQVWQVGEYSNSESDAYHRDYVFYQGAMTDAEIESVFKTKMKATKDGLYIQNGISSGIIL